MEKKLEKLKIIKWNIYNARVPFSTNFNKNKCRPVVVIGIIADDILILPITSNIKNKNKYSIKVELKQISLIKTGNIQNINRKDFISPYYINDKIVRLDKLTILKIKHNVFNIIINDDK